MQYIQTLLLAPLMLFAGVVHAEDAAHRADRLRTKALNEQARAVVKQRDAGNDAMFSRHDRDVAAYQRAMADWRRRSAACREGEYSACDEH